MINLKLWRLFLILFFGISLVACNSSCSSGNEVIKQSIINHHIALKTLSGLENLQDYNVLIHRGELGPNCGGTVIQSNRFETLVLTAAHCIMEDDETPMKYGFIDTGDENLYRVEVIKFHRGNDLALLKVTDKIKPIKAARIARLTPAIGDDIWIIGFGAGVGDALSKGIVSKVHGSSWRDIHVMQLDVTGWYGNSGGGAYNANQELVGVVIEFGPQGGAQAGWMFATHLEEIIKFLRSD